MKEQVERLTQAAYSATLSPTDAAIVLLVRAHLSLSSKVTAGLVKKIKGDNFNWIHNDTLFNAGLRLLALHDYDESILQGAPSALLIKRLVANELHVGGPYTDGTNDPIPANAMVAQLFISLGTPLQNLHAYLEKVITRQYMNNHTESDLQWAVLWPHKLLSLTAPLDTTIYPEGVLRAALSLPHIPPQRQGATTNTTPSSVALIVQHELRTLNVSLRTHALDVWKSIVRADRRHEISQLNHAFIDSLHSPFKATYTRTINHLDVANFYIWMAYTIYDDFIDDEGKPIYLPIANIMHRKSLHHLNIVVGENKLLGTVVSKCFDAMDVANAWELTNCRCIVSDGLITIGKIPSYKTRLVLARRAGAHTLGPYLFISQNSNVSMNQKRALKSALNHYIIARQINDDLHDWKSDLSNGHISFVVAYLLRETNIKPGTYTLENIIDRLQRYFWKSGLSQLCDIAEKHIALATSSFINTKLLTQNSDFTQITITPIARSISASRSLHESQKEFLRTYKKSTPPASNSN